MIRHFLMSIIVLSFVIFAGVHSAGAATGTDLNHDAQQALDNLYQTNALARSIGQQAKGVIVFPNIVKAGLILGGSYGEGVFLKGGAVDSYFNSVSASWGLQAGAQSYGYALFLMSDKAKRYIRESHGWEICVGPTVVIVDEGAAKNLSTSTLKDDAYAFIFNQQGLMAGISLEGAKISRIKR